MTLPYKITNSFSAFLSNNCYHFRNFIDYWFTHPNALCPFVFAAFIIGIGHEVLLNGSFIFKLKFSSINLLMTIAVVAAFIWENTQQLSLLCSMFWGERLEDIGLESSNQH
jgi:cation transport ATPase